MSAALLLAAAVIGAVGGQQVPFDTIRSEDSRIEVVFAPGDSVRGARLLSFFSNTRDLPALPEGYPTRARIAIAPDERAFQGLAGGRVPDWGAAVAVPSEALIVIPGYTDRGVWDDPRTLRHEWAHLGLHEFVGGLRVPRWFSEGYAEWASGGWDWSEGWRLRILLARRNTSLDSLDLAWPRNAAEARAAYLLSATALEYLASESGARGIGIFLDRWKGSSDFEGAFRTTFGTSTGRFERDWKKYVKRRYGWLFVLSHSAVFWIFLSSASVLLWRIRRNRNRLLMARLRAREIPELPAYWLPPAGGEGFTYADEGARRST